MPATYADSSCCRREGIILVCYVNGRKLFRGLRLMESLRQAPEVSSGVSKASRHSSNVGDSRTSS
jgi:hypothetical protein